MTAKLLVIASMLFLIPGCASTANDEAALADDAAVAGQDPKWAPYADYLKRAIARVQKQWERELVESRKPPPAGVSVTVVFWLASDGSVSRIDEVKGEPDGIAMKACLSAISLPRTFQPWTEEMKGRLGPEEKLTFSFHYQK